MKEIIMRSTDYEHALTVLGAQPFGEMHMRLIEAAASDVPWAAVSSALRHLQYPETAEAGWNETNTLIADADKQHKGFAGMCVLAAAMYATGRRLHEQGVSKQVLNDTFCCLYNLAAASEAVPACL